MRIVKERAGLYRYPEPKILAGSNYADVGFELDASTGRVVALCAIDNLMKGAAGTALQCANLMSAGTRRSASSSRGCIRSERQAAFRIADLGVRHVLGATVSVSAILRDVRRRNR